jgi:hypothetical protein
VKTLLLDTHEQAARAQLGAVDAHADWQRRRRLAQLATPNETMQEGNEPGRWGFDVALTQGLLLSWRTRRCRSRWRKRGVSGDCAARRRPWSRSCGSGCWLHEGVNEEVLCSALMRRSWRPAASLVVQPGSKLAELLYMASAPGRGRQGTRCLRPRSINERRRGRWRPTFCEGRRAAALQGNR